MASVTVYVVWRAGLPIKVGCTNDLAWRKRQMRRAGFLVEGDLVEGLFPFDDDAEAAGAWERELQEALGLVDSSSTYAHVLRMGEGVNERRVQAGTHPF